jgi:hypothetical protein
VESESFITEKLFDSEASSPTLFLIKEIMRASEPLAKIHKPLRYILEHTDGRVHRTAKLLAKQGQGRVLNIIALNLYKQLTK